MKRTTALIFAFILALVSLSFSKCGKNRENYHYFTVAPGDWIIAEEQQFPLRKGVLDAVESVPSWLRDDLYWKMKDLSLEELQLNGEVAATLFDVNSDGLPDLAVGTEDGLVKFYINTGTKHHPVFSKDNVYVPSEIDVVDNATPFSADVDGDGDMDLVVGNNRGQVFLYENIGTTNGLVRFKERQDVFVIKAKDKKNKKQEKTELIDVGTYSVPVLFDMDGDGDLDLIVGAGDGKIHYFINTGNSKHPEWKEDRDEKNGPFYKHTSLFHGIEAGKRAAPALYYSTLEGKKNLILLVFNGEGNLKVFSYDKEGHIEKKFNRLPPDIYTSHWREEKNTGRMIKPWPPEKGILIPRVVDIDADSYKDILLGSSSGRVHLIKDIAYRNSPEQSGEGKLTAGSEWLGGYDLKKGGTIPITSIKVFSKKYPLIYSSLLLKTKEKYRDELAFIIAHTATSVLKTIADAPEDKEGVTYSPEVLLDNVKELYKTAPSIPYAKLVEKGKYTTVALRFKDNKWHELPREIYYWYIVHPRTRFEAPSFYLGRFWREFLPYDKKYGKNALEAVKGAKDVYDAVLKLHEWSRAFVEWGEESHDKLPEEPYNANYGSCGEWSIFGVALGRTFLIPTRLANDWGEDHVWNEFYSDGKWHRWDLNFETKKGIDYPQVYEKEWKKYISTIWSIRGDDYIYPISEKYTGLASVKIKVIDDDTHKHPIAGAMVIVLSRWAPEKGYDKVPLLSIWGVTDENGEIHFKLGEDRYKFVISAPGYGIKTVELNDPQGNKNHIIEGKSYNLLVSYGFTIEKPEKYRTPEVSSANNIKGKIYKVKTFSFQRVRVPLDYPAKYHYITGNEYLIPSKGNLIYFVCSKAEFEKFRKGENFKAIAYGKPKEKITVPDGYLLVFLNRSSSTWYRIKLTSK